VRKSTFIQCGRICPEYGIQNRNLYLMRRVVKIKGNVCCFEMPLLQKHPNAHLKLGGIFVTIILGARLSGYSERRIGK
jgi:hypothetical protein